MKYIVLMLLAFLQVVLAMVLGYKKHSKVSKVFILFAINMAVWTVANILLDYYQYHVKDQLTFIDVMNRFGFFSGTLSLITVYRLSLVFPLEKAKNRVQTIITCVGLVVPFLTLSPLISGSFSQSAPGEVATYTYGPLVFLVGLYVLVIAGLSLKNVFGALRSVDPIVKRQARTVFAGLILSIFVGTFFTTVLPAITGSEQFLFVGYYAPLLFTASVFYSIFRQQLLNFRLFVARSVAYIILVATVAAFYAILVFGVSNELLGAPNLNLIQQTFYVLAALFLAFSFQPIKRFIDKWTNKIFYRDAYDPQAFLNDLNSGLVSSIELQTIMKNTSLLVEHYLNPVDVTFVIYPSQNTQENIYSTNDKYNAKKESLLKVSQEVKAKVVGFEDDPDTVEVLRKHKVEDDVGLIAKLISTGEKGNERTVGALILGPKKSGNPYAEQDRRVIEIVADELVIAIQNALRFEEIQQFNITLQQKVDDATAQLRKANQKLIAMDQTKDDFISMASHQLRTPLTSVKGYVSMVLEGDVGKISDQQRKLLDQSFLSAQRMVYLIADLLNVSRLKTGKFVIESKPTNLAEVVEGELAQLKETAAARKLTMTYDKPKDFPMLDLDETKIRQVIMNFADNAIYYTPSGGRIEVKLKDKGESVEFTVKDNGIGVPKSEQHNLFNKFYRAGNARKARPDGTGLGLYMAKKVVVAQGGEIIFKTEEGKGSTFGFKFEKKKLVSGTKSVQFDDDEELAEPKT